MSDFLRLLISLSLSGGALTLLTALLNRILKDRLPRTFLYYLWLPVLVRFLLPVGTDWSLANRLVSPQKTVQEETASPEVTAPAITPSDPAMIIPNISQIPSIPDITDVTNTMDNTEPIVPVAPKQEKAAFRMPSLPAILTAVWALGVLLCIIWRFHCYRCFNRHLRKNKLPVNDWERELFRTLTAEKKTRPALRRSKTAQSPMLTGMLFPIIWLPKEPLDAVDLSYALRHELTHWYRHDLWLKWVAVLTACFHWFNPAAWYLIYALDRDCELSCDELVIRGFSKQERTGYGELLLHCAAGAPSASSLFVPFANQKRMMKERMQTIVRKNPDGKKARILLAVAAAAIILSGTALGAYAFQTETDSGTSEPADTRDQNGGEDNVNIDETDADTESEDDTDSSAPADNALDAYKEVLLGNATFYNTETGETDDIYSILDLDFKVSDEPMHFERFAVLDMDGDGTLEVIAVVDPYAQFSLILHWQDGTVYGELYYIRSLDTYVLKADGSFGFDSSAFEGGYARLLFIDGAFVYDEIFYMNESMNPADSVYMIDSEPVTKEEFEASVAKREELPDPVWYDFNENNIETLFFSITITQSPELWLTAENELQFPFDLATETYIPDRHVVPKEALQAATTESLLRAVKQYTAHFARYWLYNFPSYYLASAERFNAAGELEQRLDLAEVLLATYEEEDLEKEDEVVLEEILLAGNFVFDQTDEEMRERILAAVMKKEYLRRTGTDTADHPSGFLAYITEMKDTDASLWYAYIMEETTNASAKACLEDYEGSFYWPYISDL